MGRTLPALRVTEAELLNGPERGELKINIIWEVDKENELNFGMRTDGAYLLWGALPGDMSPEDVAERVRRELVAAKAARAAREKSLKKQRKEAKA